MPARSEGDRAELLERLQDSVSSLLAAVAEASVPVLELVVPLVEEASVAVAQRAARQSGSGSQSSIRRRGCEVSHGVRADALTGRVGRRVPSGLL